MKRFANTRLLLVCLVNLAWATGFTWLLVTGVYSMYISERLWPLIAGGAGLCLLKSVMLLVSSRMRERCDESSTDLVSAGILLIPLFYFAFYEGDTLGSFALEKRAICMVERLALVELTASWSDTVETNLKELTDNYPVYAGRTVLVEGLFYASEGLPVLYRFLIVCCLNDAIPRAVFIEMEEHYENDQWLRITGRADTVRIDDGIFPCVKDVYVEVLSAPASPYLYP